MIPLYNLPRDVRIKVKDLKVNGVLTEEINFHHIDGMYSLCTDDEGNIFHLNATLEVEMIDGKITKVPNRGQD